VNESVSVETLKSISPNDAAALARLLGQLSTTAGMPLGWLLNQRSPTTAHLIWLREHGAPACRRRGAAAGPVR
jgi:hypothetical protein